jgi:hypothetical protein
MLSQIATAIHVVMQRTAQIRLLRCSCRSQKRNTESSPSCERDNSYPRRAVVGDRLGSPGNVRNGRNGALYKYSGLEMT